MKELLDEPATFANDFSRRQRSPQNGPQRAGPITSNLRSPFERPIVVDFYNDRPLERREKNGRPAKIVDGKLIRSPSKTVLMGVVEGGTGTDSQGGRLAAGLGAAEGGCFPGARNGGNANSLVSLVRFADTVETRELAGNAPRQPFLFKQDLTFDCRRR